MRSNPGIAFLFALVLAGGAVGCSGCGTLGLKRGAGYLTQAARGQFMLSNRAVPIEKVLRDETTSPRVKTLLSEVAPIKAFGQAMGLKPTANYVDYVKLDRPDVVTVVAACRPLAFDSLEWKFPIVGGFPYLGFFDPATAEDYARELRSEGWDVYVRGARAYSTLGWFRDAVLSSMIPEGEETFGDLVDVVLHESLHATVYVGDQSFFNESLASFAAEKLTPLYLRTKFGPDSKEEKAYLAGLAHETRVIREFQAAYARLDALYRGPASDAEKLAEKERTFARLRKDLGLTRELNNAALVQYKAYNDGKPAFESFYQKCGTDWRRFLSAVSRLKRESFSLPQQEDLAPALSSLSCD